MAPCIRLVSREYLAPSSHFDVLRRKAFEPKRSLVFAVVAELLELPKDHPAVARCFFSIAAPTAMLMHRDLTRKVLPSGGQAEAQALEAHLLRFALEGIAAIAAIARNPRA